MLLLRAGKRGAEAMLLLGNKKEVYGCASGAEVGSGEMLDGASAGTSNGGMRGGRRRNCTNVSVNAL